jgi:hypothetical protein
MGCASSTLTAAFPTNQSPPITSRGDPFNEYGCTVALMIGKRERNTRPAPRAPLGVQSDIFPSFSRHRRHIPMEILSVRQLMRHLGLDEFVVGIHP